MGLFDTLLKNIQRKPLQTDFEQNYFVERELGKGAFATVKQVTKKSDGKKFAVKIIDKKRAKGQENSIQDEIEVLRQLSHRHIISMVDLYESSKFYYLVMELATGGELFERILAKGFYTEQDAASLIKQLLSALVYIHNEVGIVHRDLKPENLLFRDKSEESDLLLTDFGLARVIQHNEFLSTSCGTPHCNFIVDIDVAPEILRESGHGKPVDMWSTGVITFVLICGYTPFWGGEANSMPLLYDSILSGKFEYEAEYWGMVSSSCKDFIDKLLVLNPAKRMTALEAQNHPWLLTDAKVDLLPNVRKNFNAKTSLRKAILAVQMMNKLKTADTPSLSE